MTENRSPVVWIAAVVGVVLIAMSLPLASIALAAIGAAAVAEAVWIGTGHR